MRSERQLVREVQVNVADRRFLDTDIEQQIFDAIVCHAIGPGLVGSDGFYTDSIHMKVNANKEI